MTLWSRRSSLEHCARQVVCRGELGFSAQFATAMVTRARTEVSTQLNQFHLAGASLPTWLGLVALVGCIAGETSVGATLKLLVPHNAFGILYLIGVLVIATGWGRRLGVTMAVVSALSYDLLRNWPDVCVTLTRLQDWVVIFVFVITALVAHILAGCARTSAADAEERKQQADVSRERLRALAEQQAGLRRIATVVANAVRASDIFPVVTAELAQSLRVGNASLWRYETDGTATLLAAMNDPEQTDLMPVGSRWSMRGQCIAAMVAASGRPARLDNYDSAAGDVAGLVRRLGLRCCAGAPIIVHNRLWGVAVVGAGPSKCLPDDIEQRVAEFSELVAIAVANAEDRAALSASRARIVAAADDARRRLERDLHDGAQQRLLALAMQLRSFELDVPSELHSIKEQLSDAVASLNAASSDLRELARGIHPAIQSCGGLGAALRELAGRSTTPVRLCLELRRPIPDAVEVAAYFVVAEALTNVSRHANASQVEIHIIAAGKTLRLTIRDDGIGGADAAKGSGITGLIDRAEAFGGRMHFSSPRGAGTILNVVIPLPPEPHDMSCSAG